MIMRDAGVPASTFSPAARAALRPLTALFSPTHFHEEPYFCSRYRVPLSTVGNQLTDSQHRHEESAPRMTRRSVLCGPAYRGPT